MHSHLTAQLESISLEALSDQNPYQLSREEKSDFTIVLNTLKYIARESDKKDSPLNIRLQADDLTAFYPDAKMSDYAVIHLEEFKSIPKADRKAYMIGSLVNEFISCFNTARTLSSESGRNYVKEFASKMEGVCLDARVRSAFKLVRTLEKPPTFGKMVENCCKKLGAESSYFSVFTVLLTDEWSKEYSAEEAQHHKMGEKAGTLTSDKLSEISQSLALILQDRPDKDFLQLYKTLPDALRPLFYKFVLLHEDYLKTLSLEENEVDKFNEFMSAALIHSGKIDLALTYLERLSEEERVRILVENISPTSFAKLSDKNKISLLKIINQEAKDSPSLLRTFYTKLLYKDAAHYETALLIAVRENKHELVAQLLQFGEPLKLRVDQRGLNILHYAVLNNNLELLKIIYHQIGSLGDQRSLQLLIWAMTKKNISPAIIQWLADCPHFDKKAKYKGFTAIESFAAFEEYSKMYLLLKDQPVALITAIKDKFESVLLFSFSKNPQDRKYIRSDQTFTFSLLHEIYQDTGNINDYMDMIMKSIPSYNRALREQTINHFLFHLAEDIFEKNDFALIQRLKAYYPNIINQPFIRDDQRTLIDLAVESHNIQMTKELIMLGGNPAAIFKAENYPQLLADLYAEGVPADFTKTVMRAAAKTNPPAHDAIYTIKMCNLFTQLATDSSAPLDLSFITRKDCASAQAVLAAILPSFEKKNAANATRAKATIETLITALTTGQVSTASTDATIEKKLEDISTIYVLINNSKVTNKYAALGKIRQSALALLQAQIQGKPASEQIATLKHAANQPIFKEYRMTSKLNVYQLFKRQVVDTSSVKTIKNLLHDLEHPASKQKIVR